MGVCLLAAFLITDAGCTRRFFRTRADRDVDAMLCEKNVDPRWKLEQFYVYPDPRARFADWTNPDRPPMPPDDPPAAKLAPQPQKPRKAGIEYIAGHGYVDMLNQWDEENRRELAEQEAKEKAAAGGKTAESTTMGLGSGASPATTPLGPASAIPDIQRELTAPVTVDGPLPLATDVATKPEEKPYLIKLEQVIELACINSRELQTQREQLYLAALPVTLERFAFAAQFFAVEQIFRQYFGSGEPGGQRNNWVFNTSIGFGKLFSTGALLLAQMSNQTIVNLGSLFGTPTPRSLSQTTISLDFIQPLLRGGGRAVTLEPMTQAERNLLYAMRDFVRFRQQFFVVIAAGQPQFIPGVSAGVLAISPGTVTTPGAFVPGAAGLPAVLGTGLPSPVPSVVPGTGGRNGPINPGSPTPQGVLGTIQDRATLTNQYRNVRSLQNFLERFQVYQEGGLVNPVQVGSVRQQLLNAINQVLNNQVNYRTDYDQLKLQLGLPLTVPLVVDDEPLRPMFRQVARYEDLSNDYIADVDEVTRMGRLEDDPAQLRARLRKMVDTSRLLEGTRYQETLRRRLADWEKVSTKELDARRGQLLAERRKLLDVLSDFQAKNQPVPQDLTARIDQASFEIDLATFELLLRQYAGIDPRKARNPQLAQVEQTAILINIRRAFVALLEGAYGERQEQIRQSWPPLPPFCVNGVDLLRADDDAALNTVAEVALTTRLDLMNARAQLVDAWRKIAVTANSLLGVANVQYHLDATTPAELAQPFDFSTSRSRHELIFNLQPPLVRRAERNNYRSTLIAYQQQRRAFMASQDFVLFAVRFELRQMRAVANNYHRIQKPAIELAYSQVGQALEAFNQPATPTGPSPIQGLVGAPGQPGGGGGGGGGDPAALTNQLLGAQNALVQAQNLLYTTWITYLSTRMNIYRDLGLMPLDARGVWLDDVANCDCQSAPSGQPGPIGPQRQAEGAEQLPQPSTLPPAPGPAPGEKR